MRRAVTSASALVCIGVAVCTATSANAAEPLFPAPLHITRQIQDPLATATVVIDEYGYGNRLVSVRGAKTSIADYERGELTEIDRDTATYSVTRFEALAKALQVAQGLAPETKRDDSATSSLTSAREMRSTGLRTTKLGRNAEYFEADVATQGMKQRVEVALDRSVLVSKGALEVLVGAAYPFARRPEHDLVMATARERRGGGGVATMSGQRDDLYALPIEQLTVVELDGSRLELRASVVRVGSEPPPADVVSIPAGARLVPSRYVAIQHELERVTNPALPAPNVP